MSWMKVGIERASELLRRWFAARVVGIDSSAVVDLPCFGISTAMPQAVSFLNRCAGLSGLRGAIV